MRKKNILALISLFIFTLIILSPFYFLKSDSSNRQITRPSSLQDKEQRYTLYTKSNQTISATKATNDDLERLQIGDNKLPADTLTSTKNSNEASNEENDELIAQGQYPKRLNRYLTGANISNFTDEKIELPMLNEISADWETKLGEELFRFQEENTSLIINHEDSWIEVNSKNEGRFIERVNIFFIMPNQERRSYSAHVDSQNGQIIRTWNLSRSERALQINKKATLTLPDAT
ncbi:MAG: hypothetical protein A2504_01255 [Bdellovibrionales bacterium RIFOXYD12_FULL_39_22]|nr:MAG: hypothetical protein A2385_02145 [Bdellovibrionales bacterium RIFOXYB1_FULL_39_21]OFZ42735.1 MAG: hypothetical protein A2485_10330 [Bdellovibrionales bacterium RIFOXYC12_FULL_39_17]OFZ47294.1 MAG: hypothetical protein A2404_14935 [Bdellovibrionales bacterium RIFOXYC1_FULL_39_130]OFZ71424.1 MAG: hypothetical protein A2451_10735 [Bdellovibrionales bacterium RIFOXYC2_FULL_39_8]OFZ75460.1 MAG: hypothetical protein A2560_04205 [Bdellovibrionales bacterium RIFOXYD1_FULL_39_84]OFZ93414.1 MAG: